MLFEKQDYQENCVANIVAILEECDVRNNDFSNLDKAVKNLWQKEKYTQFTQKNKNRIDVLMETGTGKTFTYLKTIFEINKNFDKKKFIIVVPRTAIKLGVIQNIKLTRDYFYREYKKYLKYIDYPKDGLSKIIQDFFKSDDLSILITTNSAFNSDKNRINQPNENITRNITRQQEKLFEIPSVWKDIKERNPIIIIDEPHLLKGKETQRGLEKLKDSLQIRFGATFPTDQKNQEHHLSNVVYNLDSISAFRKFLVKGITVHTLISDEEQGALKIISIESKQKKFTVVYDINKEIFTQTIRLGEDIGAKTGFKKYTGVKPTKINKEEIFLNNGETLQLAKSGNYQLGDQEIKAMVKTTIAKHFLKEQQLFQKGIKTLSLFFIPNIKDFRQDENNQQPKIKKFFEKEYLKQRQEILKNKKIDTEYKQYLEKDINEEGKLLVHQGYFSGDKVSTKDKNAGLNKDDLGVNIILNEKEKLLSFKTPLRFIFSVWALQEGWDNPNIFTICKLASTNKETSRRQQVGRGLRIAVDQNGNRFTYKKLAENENKFYQVNNLDVIVSHREKEFIKQIQHEIQNASYSLVGSVVTLDTLKSLEMSDDEAATVFNTLRRKKIINEKGNILFSIYNFLKDNRKELDITCEFNGMVKITDEQYEKILRIFQDNRNILKDGNKKTKHVTIRSNKWIEFKELWETINKKSKIVYKNIEEEKIIKSISETFNKENIAPIEVKLLTQKYDAQNDNIENKEESKIGNVNFFTIKKLEDFIDHFVKKEKFSFSFMVKLLNQIDRQKIKNNPEQAKKRLIEILKETIHGTILSSIESCIDYQFLETTIYPNELQDTDTTEKTEIPYTLLGKNFTEDSPEHNLYDTICYDSKIEKEIQENDPSKINDNKITVFAKLPKISIPTPYKTYNPDFAYLIEKKNKKKLFLVVETKGYDNENDIPDDEKNKIEYAKKFFKALQEQIPKIEICYKTRINRKSLGDLLKDCRS